VKLYAVLLGGSSSPDRLAEDHETVFVVAQDDLSAKRQGKKKWAGRGRAHVDALLVLEAVDGFAVELVPGTGSSPAHPVSLNDAPHDEEGS
jgi:hypothetical protein